MAPTRDILVLGAGVIGLTSAHVLSARGHQVRVLARDMPPHTTSNQAGAFWFPFLTGAPTNHDEALAWAKRTYQRLLDAASHGAAPGLARQSIVSVLAEPGRDPWWAEHVHGYRRATPPELGGAAEGCVFQSVVIEPDRYLHHLVRTLELRGVTFEVADLATFDDAFAYADVVVNCTGLGARALCDDEAVYPARGQIVRASAKLNDVMIGLEDAQGPVYLVPRSDDLVLGGTKQIDDWDVQPRDADTQAILARCGAVAPAVRDTHVLEARVGLRPCRDAVRVETESLGRNRHVVHNYGHGGSGFTLSWGCAETVGELVQAIVRR